MICRRCLVISFCALTLTAAAAHVAQGAPNRVEFRPVLSEAELGGKAYDVVTSGDETLYVWKLRYLGDNDLDKVDIRQSATKGGEFIIVIKFNKEGKKRLYKFTKKFAKRRVAIFVEGKLVTVPLVWIPHFMGDKVVAKWPGNRKDLFAFASKINNANPSIASLYIEEQANYNDAAAEEWGNYYTGLNRYIEEQRKRFAESSATTEADREI